ncbi:hypothetical protein CEP53_000695 [Fusarium sp. AF-6]|nr:hypothetical protein CEP53_000695 [Fusarium sp. AF-6]
MLEPSHPDTYAMSPQRVDRFSFVVSSCSDIRRVLRPRPSSRLIRRFTLDKVVQHPTLATLQTGTGCLANESTKQQDEVTQAPCEGQTLNTQPN